jgi:hypothetical protein
VEEALEELAAGRKGELTAAAGLGAGGGSVWAGGRACVTARGGGFLLKRPVHSLGTGGQAEDAPGDARGRTTRERTAGPCVRLRGSGCEAFPAFEAS